MKKMKTLFVMDYSDKNKSKITNVITPGCDWVFSGGIPTRKWDGKACMVKDGILYKRYDAKINKKTGKRRKVPDGAIPCQPKPDPITGHFPHWVKVDYSLSVNKYHKEAFLLLPNPHLREGIIDKNNAVIIQDKYLEDGTYELVGPKINGNKDGFAEHTLVKHGNIYLNLRMDWSDILGSIRNYLENHMFEGIVFHHKTDKTKMCKIRRKDFGFEW